MRCEIDRGPMLRGEGAELVLGNERFSGLSDEVMTRLEAVGVAWTAREKDLVSEVEVLRDCRDAEIADLEADLECRGEELDRAEREVERLRALLKEYGIDPDEADDEDDDDDETDEEE